MKFFSAISWLALASSSVAYVVSDVKVSLSRDGNTVQPTNGLTIDSQADRLEIDFKLKGKGQPHQLVLAFSGGDGLDYALYPKFNLKNIKTQIVVGNLPDALKWQDKILVSVIAASSESNVEEKVVELYPSETLRNSLLKKKVTRVGAKPEIHHVFKQDVETVGAFLPIVFSGLAVALLAVLLVVWLATLKDELFGAKDGSIWKVGYLCTLTMFEFTFAKYYLGASIFTILFQGALLAGPMLFFGARSLSALARARA